MSFAYTLLAFLTAILLLVSLHELGHLLVARWCGIKVLRFSIGFGKPFYTKRWRNIDWCLAPFPLGGYVKMVDTREGEVAPEDLPLAFDKQHPLKRIAVVVAGPLTNLALAVLLYAFSFGVGGITEVRPYVGEVEMPSVAAAAGFQEGDRIVSVNGSAVDNFADAQTRMILDLEAGKVIVAVEDIDGEQKTRIIDAAGSPEAAAIAKRRSSLGLHAFKIDDTIGIVQKGSPADKAGLRKGDRIVAINGMPTPKWADWGKIVRDNAGKKLALTYLRDGEEKQTTLLPNAVRQPESGKTVGQIGVGAQRDEAWAAKIRRHYVPDWGSAWRAGWDKTVGYSTLTLQFFGKLVTGQASINHISGPITIADVAGQTAKIGWQPYIEFLALVSISLGVMNLLPVPVLDGGHLVYYTAELLRGKPLSQAVQQWGLRFGLAVMLAMMVLAFFNDISRLLG